MSDLQSIEIPFSSFTFDKIACITGLGYGESYPDFINSMFDDTLAQAEKRCQAQAGWVIIDEKDFRIDAPRIKCDGVTLTTGGIVAKHAKGSIAAAAILGTAGSGIEEWSRKLISEGDPLTGFMGDCIGSQVADQSAKKAAEHIKQLIARKGWKATPLFGPGTCGWDVSDQHQFFKLFPGRFLGITLSESSLMHPIKSVSGLIGLGPEVDDTLDLCSVCGFEKCQNRKKK
jgi:hypothetical protein